MSEPNLVCWFCHKLIRDDETCLWSHEFDTPLHKDCLQNALNNPEEDLEADIIGPELGMTKQTVRGVITDVLEEEAEA